MNHFFMLSVLFISSCSAWECEEVYADHSWNLYDIEARISHLEGPGIGYKRGYTTLEGFFMAEDELYNAFYPFLDLKGHGFNNRKLASNLGIGIRYADANCWIWGASLWYDVRQGDHRGFNRVGPYFHQAGLSLEALGPLFDVRLNLYQPVGKQTKRFTQVHFEDNAGITPIFSFKKQSTFSAFDLEAGGYIGCGNFCNCVDWQTYFAIGPYFIREACKTGKWGAKARFKADVTPYWTFEVRSSYDQLYLGSLQFQITFNLPLYPRSSLEKETCCGRDYFREQMTQTVQRMDIMPLRTHHIPLPL